MCLRLVPRLCLAVLLVLATGCSSTVSQPPAAKTSEAAPPPPVDQSIKFPQLNQVKMELVPDHLLGKDFMPGGNLGSYKLGKIEYQQFLGKFPDAQKAAFSLLDWRIWAVTSAMMATVPSMCLQKVRGSRASSDYRRRRPTCWRGSLRCNSDANEAA
jgi:hypothetical protein